MFTGWVRYDGTEVINIDRTSSYVEAGVRPPKWDLTRLPDSVGLGTVLGDTPYRTPDYDSPPWYVVTDDATAGFAGIMPVDITGLEGSSFTGEVTENQDEGGTVTTARRASKTFQVTGLLVGDSDEALHAGMEWLTGVLLRRCGDTSLPATLETFTAPPGGLAPLEDIGAALVTTTVELDDPDWLTVAGIWDYDSTFTVTGTPPSAPTSSDVAGGGGPSDTSSDVVGGGGPSDAGTPVVGGGVVEAPGPYAVLATPGVLDCLSRVDATWQVGLLPGATSVLVQPAAVDTTGRVLERGPVTAVTGARSITWTVTDAPWDGWRMALLTTQDGVSVTSVSVAKRPDLVVADCLTAYRRTHARVKCVAAPQVTAIYDTDDAGDGALWQVEWTWVAEDPYRYLDPVTVATGVHLSGTAPTFRAPGVSATYIPSIGGVLTECPLPDTDAGTCVTDPTAPRFTAPPKAPVIGDDTVTVPGTYRRSLLSLDPSVVPTAGQAALTLTLHNDGTAKRGLRVRLWQQTDPDFATHDECGFDTEAWVDYLAGDTDLVIDTVGGTVTALCPDDTTADARGVMHGSYRGAFSYPVLTCGGRWFIAVDVPAGQGVVTWDLTYAAREG